MSGAPAIVLFDLDGVLAHYDHAARLRVLAERSGASADAVARALLESGWNATPTAACTVHKGRWTSSRGGSGGRCRWPTASTRAGLRAHHYAGLPALRTWLRDCGLADA